MLPSARQEPTRTVSTYTPPLSLNLPVLLLMALSVSRDPWEPSRGKGCGSLRFQERSDWVLGEAAEFRESTRRGRRCREESRHGAQECARHGRGAWVRFVIFCFGLR